MVLYKDLRGYGKIDREKIAVKGSFADNTNRNRDCITVKGKDHEASHWFCISSGRGPRGKLVGVCLVFNHGRYRRRTGKVRKMAATPKYKVFDSSGIYQASCKEPEAALALMSFYGSRSTIRTAHSPRWTIWTEGAISAISEIGYDRAVVKMAQRESQNRQYWKRER